MQISLNTTGLIKEEFEIVFKIDYFKEEPCKVMLIL